MAARKHTSSHRGHLDIIAAILEASSNGTKKTYLMYRCNLSFRQLKYYLALLLHKRLLCAVLENGGANVELFRATDKGKTFLKTYKSLISLME